MGDLLENVPLLIIVGSIGIPALIYALLGLGERICDLLPGRSGRRIRPFVWLAAPIVLVVLILLYPVVSTIISSFKDARGEGFVGLDNFVWAFSDTMTDVIANNLLWLVVFPLGTLILALVAAVLFDRVKYERVAVTMIILPTAISFVAGAVIWTQMYSYQPAKATQIGTFNAIITQFGMKPIPWLQQAVINNFALILIAVWLSLGIATLILSAAVKNVPSELLEAARLDGAGEWRVFRQVIVPSIMPAVMVVLTTEIIAALKIFDIVYVLTNGNYNTDVIANKMYSELFAVNNLGHASAIAVILLVAAMPVVLINIVQFRAEAN